MNKKHLTKKDTVLETLLEAGGGGISFLEAILRCGYGASIQKIMRAHQDGIAPQVKNIERFSIMISKLKKEGLISKSGRGLQSRLKLTSSGRKRIKEKAPLNIYETEDSDSIVIIIFDIPEKKRGSRNWLRNILISINFTMIQKSVWMGRKKIPKEMLDDMRKMRILEHIEILTIKGGTIEEG